MLMTRYTRKKSSCLLRPCCNFASVKRIPWMSRFYALVKITLVMSHRDVIAAFKARWLFQAIKSEILCNLCTEKCENNAFENSDTLDGWLCDPGPEQRLVLLLSDLVLLSSFDQLYGPWCTHFQWCQDSKVASCWSWHCNLLRPVPNWWPVSRWFDS